MKLVVGPAVREHVDKRGGAVYVWSRAVRCCSGKALLLEASTEQPERTFELVHAADGFQVFAPPGLVEPDELHLELTRRRQLRAYWNGQDWIG